MSGKVNWRLIVFALACVAFAGWALTSLASLSAGSLVRTGPAQVPRFAAVVLLAIGAVVLVRAVTGLATAPARPLRWPWRLALVVPLLATIFLGDVLALFPDAPGADAIAGWIQDLALRFGPSELLAMLWLRWLSAIAIGVIVVGDGATTGLAALFAGGLIGLSGTDVMSGESRLSEIDAVLEEFPFWIEGAVLALLLACRVNPLPAILAYVGAGTAEEMFRRAMLLTRGEPLLAASRPITLTLLLIAVLIALALIMYRWPGPAPWRGRA